MASRREPAYKLAVNKFKRVLVRTTTPAIFFCIFPTVQKHDSLFLHRSKWICVATSLPTVFFGFFLLFKSMIHCFCIEFVSQPRFRPFFFAFSQLFKSMIHCFCIDSARSLNSSRFLHFKSSAILNSDSEASGFPIAA